MPLLCSKEIKGLLSPKGSFLLRRGRGCSWVELELDKKNGEEMSRGEIELRDTLTFSFNIKREY